MKRTQGLFLVTVLSIIVGVGLVSGVPVGGEIYYDFENQVNNQWNSFGNGNAANLTYTSGILGNAGNFGSTVTLNVTHPVVSSQGSNFTIMFYFKPNGTITDELLFSNKRQGADAARFVIQINSTGHITPNYVRQDTGTAHIMLNESLKVSVPSSTWHSFAFAMNDTQTRIYLDGLIVYQNTTLSRVETITTEKSAYIGSRAYGDYGLRFNGSIDEFKSVNRSMSESEILAELVGNDARAQAIDTYSLQSITSYNVTWENATSSLFNSTTSGGTVRYANISGYYNITVRSNGYVTNTSTNWNVSNTLTAYMSAGTIAVTGSLAGFNMTVSSTSLGTEYATNTTTGTLGLVRLVGALAPTGNLTLNVQRQNSTSYLTTFIYSNDDHTFNVSFYENTSILNVSFFDVITNLPVFNVSLDLIGLTNKSTNTTTGKLYLSNILAGDYVLRYTNPQGWYATHRYSITVSPNTYTELPLYLMNASRNANITATVLDQRLNELEGAILEVHRYNPITGSYLLVDRLATNFEGKAFFNGEVYGEFYRFLIRYQGELVYSSTPTILTGDPLNFKVVLTSAVAESFYSLGDLQYTFAYNNATHAFNLLYSYPTSSIVINMTTFRMTTSGEVQVQSDIMSTSSGIINHAITNTTNTAYKSCFLANFGEAWELVNCQYADFKPHLTGDGQKLALFLLIVLEIVIAFLFFADIVLALIAFPLPFLFFELAGLTSIGLPYAVSLELLFIIIAWIVGRNN